MPSENIKVSVCVTAYNVGKYIDGALESVIRQSADFRYEILIAEDFSTDNTREMVEAWGRKYKDRDIRIFYNAKNFGWAPSLVNLINNARGEYILQMDGDDVTLGENRLQLLVDFLDSHPQYAVCVHNYQLIDAGGNILVDDALGKDYIHRETDTFLYTSFGGGMGMWRRSALPSPLPKWLKNAGNPLDHAIFLLASAGSKTGYLPIKLMQYRRHDTNSSSLTKKEYFLEKDIYKNVHLRKFYANIDKKKYDPIFKWGISYYRYQLAYLKLSQGKVFSFLYNFILAFINWPVFSIKRHKDLLYQSSPELFNKLKSSFK